MNVSVSIDTLNSCDVLILFPNEVSVSLLYMLFVSTTPDSPVPHRVFRFVVALVTIFLVCGEYFVFPFFSKFELRNRNNC